MPWVSAIISWVCERRRMSSSPLSTSVASPRLVATCQVLGQAKLETSRIFSIFRHEFAAGEFFLDQLADGRRQVGEAIGPADLVAFGIDQGDAVVGRGNRESSDGNDARVHFAILGRQDELTVGVAAEGEIRYRHLPSSLLTGSAERWSSGSVSTLRACAW